MTDPREIAFRDVPLAREVEHDFTVNREDGCYFVRFPDLPGCMTHADTLMELAVMIPDAYWLWRGTADESGYDYPKP